MTDPQQLVSLCFGLDSENLESRPEIHRFVTEDRKLYHALSRLTEDGSVPELTSVTPLFVSELLSTVIPV